MLAYWSVLEGEDRYAFRFLHVSTDEVYGTLGPRASSPKEPLQAQLPLLGQQGVQRPSRAGPHHTYGLPTLITNCSNNYGPYQFPEKLIPLMILNALRAEPLPVYGDGQNVRDWLYVGDHAGPSFAGSRAGRPGKRTTSAATTNGRTSRSWRPSAI